MELKLESDQKCFDGSQRVYSHYSEICKCEMNFGLFLPKKAVSTNVPVLWFLSGLTCTHENAMTKSGAQTWAAEKGLALIFPDTSPITWLTSLFPYGSETVVPRVASNTVVEVTAKPATDKSG